MQTIDYIMCSMVKLRKNTALDMDSPAFIRSGLGSISAEGRERLKSLARSLLASQGRPGAPVPESVWREIVRGLESPSKKL